MYTYNVKYELQEYERLIAAVPQTHVANIESQNQDSITSSIRVEVERIKQTFVQEIFGFEDERHLERYIQYHQQALIRLLDETLKSLSSPDPILSDLYQACYTGLEDILSFVERHFAKYFDQDAKAPVAYVAIIKNDLESNLNVIRERLLNRNADPRLTDGILYALRKITEGDPSGNVSYRSILYAKELQKELLNLHSNSLQDSDVNEELRNLMYYLNYNSVKSFTYHTNYIDILLSETDSRTEMIERLSFILKKVNQAQVKPGIGYHIYSPSLKDQLNGYIIEEIEHLQRIHQFSDTPSSRSLKELIATYKIQLSMSVPQIAFFVKLLVETKLILNENVVELLRFLSKFLVSKRSETVSYDSLRSKYYNVEQSTKNSVKNVLIRMINLVDRS